MDLIKKSVNVLKSLQLKNGAILGTPKNNVYPYVYPRDAVIVTKALNKAGEIKRSEKFYYFMKNLARIDYFKEVFQRYTDEGLPSVSRKKENDNSPLMIYGIYDTYFHGKNKVFLRDMWPLVKICVNYVLQNIEKNGLLRTERSVHEFFRLENGYEIWANCAACRGLYDAAKIAEKLSKRESEKWLGSARRLNKNIKKHFFNKKLKVYMKNLNYPNVSDMSQLSPFYFEIDDNDEVIRKTLTRLKEDIWHSKLSGFRRFKKFQVVRDWHWYTGGSGPWTVMTLWGARFYKKIKDRKNYSACMNFVDETLKRTRGLLPEHISTKEEYDIWKENETEFNHRIINGMKHAEKLNSKARNKSKEDLVYWALPLGWAHAEYILLKT